MNTINAQREYIAACKANKHKDLLVLLGTRVDFQDIIQGQTGRPTLAERYELGAAGMGEFDRIRARVDNLFNKALRDCKALIPDPYSQACDDAERQRNLEDEHRAFTRRAVHTDGAADLFKICSDDVEAHTATGNRIDLLCR